jgi:ferredoxin-NADP reductase
VIRLPGRRRGHGSWLPALDRPVDDVTALRSWIPDLAEHDVYVCGPEPWTRLVVGTLSAAGLPDAQLHVEHFAW